MSLEQQQTIQDTADVAEEKDKMDLRPAIDFIEKNQQVYHKLTREIFAESQPTPVFQWARSLRFEKERKIRGPQMYPVEACQVLSRVPAVLAALSKLKTVSYEYADQIIEPVYHPDGTLRTGNTVEFDAFGTNREHPRRLLVGMTPYSGEAIYMTALPSTVYKDAEAARLYQQHVLLHEFFHTVEIARRSNEQRANILLETDGTQFTLQQWWTEFEQFVLDQRGLDQGEKPVSRYAAGYEHQLNATVRDSDNAVFTHALAEQVCESFVAYQQNIIPNDEGITDFKTHWPETWRQMDKLCRAKLIREDGNIDAL